MTTRTLSHSRHSTTSNYESILQNWIETHDGRLWHTPEETNSVIQQTGLTKLQIKNWFATRRKKATFALEKELDNPREFLSKHDSNTANILKHLFASVASSGYLPEAGKRLIAESTGLSTRSITLFGLTICFGTILTPLPELHANSSFYSTLCSRRFHCGWPTMVP
ncbi:hypothetical protein F5X97DRAFT_307477 [Nemania serpens]|nr:hypothetical protein F5X97DRAFT_307477 [Nemania serpens]